MKLSVRLVPASHIVGRQRRAGLVNPGEEGYVDDTVGILLLGNMLLIAVAFIGGDLLGLGILATVALAVGLSVLVVAAAVAANALRHRQRFGEHALGAGLDDALPPGDAEPPRNVTVRPATLEDAPALAGIQVGGGGHGRGHREGLPPVRALRARAGGLAGPGPGQRAG